MQSGRKEQAIEALQMGLEVGAWWPVNLMYTTVQYIPSVVISTETVGILKNAGPGLVCVLDNPFAMKPCYVVVPVGGARR